MRAVSPGLGPARDRFLGNVSAVQTSPAAQRVVGLGLGAVVLALLVGLAVGLPKAEGDTAATVLPDTLPGGWTATDVLDVADVPAESGITEEAIQRQADRRAYAEARFAEAYDDAPSFRTYVDETLQKFVLVTVFVGEGQAFLPGEPPVDPEAEGLARSNTELVREGDALCSVSYQPVPAGQETGDPAAVSCQQPVDGQTVQLQTQGVSLDDTFALLDDIATEIV